MRTINRDIVGAFIFSGDGKVLLGHNRKGGVYQDKLVVPGGGIEDGETKVDALKREILEEVGLDISHATITAVPGESAGESEKVLKTGERVLVKMTFYDFKIAFPEISSDITLTFEDDYAEGSWFTSKELQGAEMGPATKATLEKLHFL